MSPICFWANMIDSIMLMLERMANIILTGMECMIPFPHGEFYTIHFPIVSPDCIIIRVTTAYKERGEGHRIRVFTRKVIWGGVPSVTFVKNNGRFAFNKAAIAIFVQHAIEYVILMWDADKKLIGVKPMTKKDARTYTVIMGTKRLMVAGSFQQ